MRSGEESQDYYNLSLSETHLSDGLRWSIELGDDTMRWQVKWSMDKDLKKTVFCLDENRLATGRRLALNAVMSQQFPLYRTFSEADIRVNIKGENLQESWLKVYSLGIDEKCVGRDSIRINRCGWQVYQLHISLKNVHYLWMTFSIEGKPCEVQSGARVLIDKVDIRLDGHPINTESKPIENSVPEFSSTRIQRLSFSDDSLIGLIPLFQGCPRIIGLGETMHGCRSLDRVKNQMIRWLVEKRQCKLVMVEICSILALKWDLYVQGFPVELNEIIEELVGTTISREETVELLNFLRGYNKKAQKKVHIVGIDRSFGLRLFPLMHDYFYTMYKQKPDRCKYNLLKSNFVPDSLLPILVRPEVARSIGEFEYKWFKQLYWFKLMERHIPGVEKYGAMNYRDYIMWRHAYYALEAVELNESECAVITGHWSHLNKWNVVSSFYHSLGYYLAKNYGENYCSIALMGGEGSFTTYQWGQNQFTSACQLSPPGEGSLEKSASVCKIPYFYYPAEGLSQAPTNIRFIPMGDKNGGFRALNVCKRMDGFIFVRDCEGILIPDDQRVPDDIERVFNQRLIRMMKRNKELNTGY